MKDFKTILITGASSGLGAALAIAYAKNGINLVLVGRNQERLIEVATTCRARGAKIAVACMDVRDKPAMAEMITGLNKVEPFDLVIANAGVSEVTASGGAKQNSDPDEVFDINISGVLNTIHPVMALMQQRKSGQIAIVSSLAGLRGLPSCPSYSASKGAVRLYGEALRGTLQEYGIGVTVICPGYIKSPMTDLNDFPMPFLMSAEKAAAIIKSRLPKNPSRLAFPGIFYWATYVVSILPPAITDWFFARLPRKKV